MNEIRACDNCGGEADGEVYCGECAGTWLKKIDELRAELAHVREQEEVASGFNADLTARVAELEKYYDDHEILAKCDALAARNRKLAEECADYKKEYAYHVAQHAKQLTRAESYKSQLERGATLVRQMEYNWGKGKALYDSSEFGELVEIADAILNGDATHQPEQLPEPPKERTMTEYRAITLEKLCLECQWADGTDEIYSCTHVDNKTRQPHGAGLAMPDHCPLWAELPAISEIETVGHWTREPPTKPGWYKVIPWKHTLDFSPLQGGIVHVVYNQPTDELVVLFPGVRGGSLLPVIAWWWSEPEQLPEPPKEGDDE